MNAIPVPTDQLLRVEAVVDSLCRLDATADGRQALRMAQAGFTYPDHDWIYG